LSILPDRWRLLSLGAFLVGAFGVWGIFISLNGVAHRQTARNRGGPVKTLSTTSTTKFTTLWRADLDRESIHHTKDEGGGDAGGLRNSKGPLEICPLASHSTDFSCSGAYFATGLLVRQLQPAAPSSLCLILSLFFSVSSVRDKAYGSLQDPVVGQSLVWGTVRQGRNVA
jgi:hypothetical protein